MPATLAMEDYQWLVLGLLALRLLFVMAVGACIGSLINVLAYRMPRGLNVVTPPSACPSCGTKLTFRENIPIFGWLALRGRCRFCRDRISPEYPIVEALVALLFGTFYFLWYVVHDRSIVADTVFLCIDWSTIAPEYASQGLAATWPAFTLLLLLLACLVAMTLIDAKTFTIPLILAWIPTGAALVVHLGWAIWVFTAKRGSRPASIEVWILPTPDVTGWWWIGASIGAVAGLTFSNILLATGLLRRSFADYDQWEASVRAQEEATVKTEGIAPSAASPTGDPAPQAVVGGDPEKPRVELWIQYPHARREAIRELLFLAPCLGLAMACGAGAERLWGAQEIQTANTIGFTMGTPAPVWLVVLAGVLMGYLIGGGIVWATRILGTVATGKEAMGLGDVHLLAAVGACLGWIDSVLTFFGAAFVALGWTILAKLFSGKVQRLLPFGPHLAVAAVLVLLLKPLIEKGLTALFHSPSPIQLP